MITREVTLHRGLKVGENKAMAATIREEIVADELAALEAGLDGRALERHVTFLRVTRLGALDQPDEAILKTLARVDLDLIEREMLAMDVQIAKDAGLLKEDDAPREDEPGGAPSGEV